ncbi:EAL domain-containing protein [Treponema sp. C6A8]|uniref:sensor domain-containing protein n=1 Tax=Treponema sp. C6A8 TaxID=1410609 RepID=UPI000685CCD9|nr:EAL domain-containing protein [Treponema sp. C6A8]
MEKFRYEEQEFALIENTPVPLAVYQFLDNRVVTVALSKGFCDLFGFKTKEDAYFLTENDMYRDCHPDDTARIADAAVTFAKDQGEYDVIFRTKVNNRYRIIHSRGEHFYKNGIKLAAVWYFDEGEYVEDASISNDLTHTITNALQISSLYHKVTYDYLTGLPNMGYFFEIAEKGVDELINAGKTPVMLFFDLNGMKYFNVKYGLSEGDNLIRSFSKLLVKYFSNENCTRFGMDRFCVFTSDDDLEQRLWKFFAECENLNGGKTLPVRAGIYSSKMGRIGACFACDRAKMACDKTRNAYVSHFTYFDESMLKESQNRLYIIENFDRALKEEWIQVYYQPIVRAATGRVCDEEALSRWIDPIHGMLSPDAFIPILEESNLIYKLDLYVTEKILEKMKAQADKGLYVVPNSVNLSRSDFETCDIVKEITNRVDQSGIPHEKLTIEITESVIGSNFEYMKTQVERFQSLGFKVWMDDFGSGYSSLDVLQDFHFDLIKLDMKFMRNFASSQKSKIILTELIRMAMSLGIETIVEGVETEEQVEFLCEVGCTKLQGYHFCKPIPLIQIFERYDKGTQIGFENPAESDYYAALGKINLYDLSVITNNEGESYKNYFNTLPMGLFEVDDEKIKFTRGNKSYRTFLTTYFPPYLKEKILPLAEKNKNPETGVSEFINTVLKCKTESSSEIVDIKQSDGTVFHLYFGRIAENPVSKIVALVVVVLNIS